jgi:hypothetical protein
VLAVSGSLLLPGSSFWRRLISKWENLPQFVADIAARVAAVIKR